LTIFAVGIGIILFILGFVIGYPAILNFIFAIGVIVANVPEGLIV
jgi:sodium/potassium-transporting ATPase subunit alpha